MAGIASPLRLTVLDELPGAIEWFDPGFPSAGPRRDDDPFATEVRPLLERA